MIILDLSQSFANGMPHASTIPPPSFKQVKSIERDGLSVTQLSVATHIGTHLDAPSHFIEGGGTIDRVPLDTLVGPAMVVSVERSGGEEVTAEDLRSFEPWVSPGDALLLRTGWGNKFGTDEYLRHPYLSEDAAEWILERGFRLVGLDTVTPDMPGHLRPEGFDFPVHHLLLGNGVLIAENLFLEEVVGRRFTLIVGSLKIAGGDGAPARVLAVLDEREEL